jgi:hypothetical protein
MASYPPGIPSGAEGVGLLMRRLRDSQGCALGYIQAPRLRLFFAGEGRVSALRALVGFGARVSALTGRANLVAALRALWGFGWRFGGVFRRGF